MAPAHCERVFDLFWVQDVRHHGGGISSLPLAREIARHHGGDLLLGSSSEDGTTFVLRMPVDPPG